MVIWLIGISGAGKTTLANEVVKKVREEKGHVVLIDGDAVRTAFGNDLGHSIEDRRRNADRICGLCKLLDDQGISVICGILSIFPESRAWNRANLQRYHEVFIDTPLADVQERDVKGIYGRYARGETTGVAGLDIDFPRPARPDLVITNNGDEAHLLSFAPQLARLILDEQR